MMELPQKMKTNIFWFRRDLRLSDNHGLFQALIASAPVQCVFIFDRDILDLLHDRDDGRVHFIHQRINMLNDELEKVGGRLDVRFGKPIDVWKELILEYEISAVFCNSDFEPYGRERDEQIKFFLRQQNIDFEQHLDHLIFHPDEVLKKDQSPYTVFTPYSRIWRKLLFKDENSDHDNSASHRFDSYPSQDYLGNILKCRSQKVITLNEIGFLSSSISIPSDQLKEGIIEDYNENRDYPAKNGTTKQGIHLRFGTISIRKLAKTGANRNDTFLNELIWREFYAMILYHFPFVTKRSFRSKYDRIEWRNNETEFDAWCDGKTGYPLVDAGMRQLNETGYMHNRVRMVVASFLTKHLLIDWRWGEAYFARKLLDFELASNNGGWQWAAGCGTDAAPYFRIFNPERQMNKFDPKKEYVRRWVPEIDTGEQLTPIVDHKFARQRCLRVYKEALGVVPK